MLNVKNLVKNFAATEAVKNISFRVNKGQVFGLLGPNGAGKTTTLRMVMNIISPDSGNILYNKEAITNEILDKIGYLPEDRGLYLEQPVYEVLKYLAALKGSPPTRSQVDIVRLMDRLDVVDFADEKVHKLSRGNQQKIQIIAAIAHDPNLVILDEPFSGLDPINQTVIRELILDLKAQGKAILLSSHQMDLVESLCDQICLVNKGEIILKGELEEIRQAESEGSITIEAQGDLTFLSGLKEVTAMEYTKNGASVHLDPEYDFNTFIRHLTGKVNLIKVEKKSATLKDIYLNTIKKHSAVS